MSAAGEPQPGEMLARTASGLRHLRWAREVLATLEAHIQHNATLAASDREALRSEAQELAEEVQALSGAVKAYRDFLERTRVRYRGRVRAAEFVDESAPGDATARAELGHARAALAEMEASQRRPLRENLVLTKGRLRRALERTADRVAQRLSPAFAASLYPRLARGGSMVADDGDPDDDATASANEAQTTG